MSLSVTALRACGSRPSSAFASSRERRVRRRVGVAWLLLLLNVLTFPPGGLLHIPSTVGKVITQAALVVALLVALTVNPRVLVRPNVFLCLVSLLVLGPRHDPATPAPRYRVPDLPARRLRCHALAADAVVGSA